MRVLNQFIKFSDYEVFRNILSSSFEVRVKFRVEFAIKHSLESIFAATWKDHFLRICSVGERCFCIPTLHWLHLKFSVSIWSHALSGQRTRTVLSVFRLYWQAKPAKHIGNRDLTRLASFYNYIKYLNEFLKLQSSLDQL